jgi:hypothetical protein
MPPEEAIVGDLADDLADILFDIDRRLKCYDAGCASEIEASNGRNQAGTSLSAEPSQVLGAGAPMLANVGHDFFRLDWGTPRSLCTDSCRFSFSAFSLAL